MSACLNAICGRPYGCQRANCRVTNPPPAPPVPPERLAEQRAGIERRRRIIEGCPDLAAMCRALVAAGEMLPGTAACTIEEERT